MINNDNDDINRIIQANNVIDVIHASRDTTMTGIASNTSLLACETCNFHRGHALQEKKKLEDGTCSPEVYDMYLEFYRHLVAQVCKHVPKPVLTQDQTVI